MDIETLYTCRELFLGSNEDALIDRLAASGTEIVEMAALPFRKVSYRDRPEGLLAVAPQFDSAPGPSPERTAPAVGGGGDREAGQPRHDAAHGGRGRL
jgi:hypothetical protein